MPTRLLEKREEGVAERLDQLERTLPTLSTKADLKATEERLRTELTDAEKRLRWWPKACATWSASLPKGFRRF